MDPSEISSASRELQDAAIFSRRICHVPTQFVRLFRLFTNDERKSVLEYIYNFYQSFNYSKYSVSQLVGFTLLDKSEIDELGNMHLSRRSGDNVFWSPHQINLNWLSENHQKRITEVVNGSDPYSLATVFAEVVASVPEMVGHELINVMKECINRPIHSPELAAAISECLKFNAKLLELAGQEAFEVADYALALPVEDFLEPHEIEVYQGHADDLFELAKVEIPTQRNINLNIRSELDLIDRFRLVESDYGLLVPKIFVPTLTSQFNDLVKKVSVDKSSLLSLSPRMFEQFMADLFRSMNYEVELTKATRDGGVDLLCLKNLDGIPFRMAVELKRYKEGRPITVELVRSFVGSNVQHCANKLLYVTTSSYTKPAIEFGTKYAKHTLSLKDYCQIQEWCKEAGKDQWRSFNKNVIV